MGRGAVGSRRAPDADPSHLRALDLIDVFRSLHPEATDASWVWRGRGREIGRRFDHVLASPRLRPLFVTYRHDWRDGTRRVGGGATTPAWSPSSRSTRRGPESSSRSTGWPASDGREGMGRGRTAPWRMPGGREVDAVRAVIGERGGGEVGGSSRPAAMPGKARSSAVASRPDGCLPTGASPKHPVVCDTPRRDSGQTAAGHGCQATVSPSSGRGSVNSGAGETMPVTAA